MRVSEITYLALNIITTILLVASLTITIISCTGISSRRATLAVIAVIIAVIVSITCIVSYLVF